MTHSLTLDTDSLADLIDHKSQALAQLLELSRRQAGFIAEGDLASLLTLLSAKQKLLQRVQEMERMLDPFRGQDPEKRVWRSAEMRQQVAESAKHCEMLVAEVMALEEQGEAEMVRRRDRAADHLQVVAQASHVRSSYLSEIANRKNRFDVVQ